MTWQTGHRPLSALQQTLRVSSGISCRGGILVGGKAGSLLRVLTRSVLWYVQATFKTNNSSGAQVAAPSRPLQILGRPRRRVLLPSRRAVGLATSESAFKPAFDPWKAVPAAEDAAAKPVQRPLLPSLDSIWGPAASGPQAALQPSSSGRASPMVRSLTAEFSGGVGTAFLTPASASSL